MTLLRPRELHPYYPRLGLLNSAYREYLVDKKYVAPGKVAINGGSNGGMALLHSFTHPL
jgi:hypothetical protein